MSANKYTAGTKIAYIMYGKLEEDEIWLVRNGYYHMPSDDCVHDENILGCVIDGKRIPNELFLKEREHAIKTAQAEIEQAKEWIDAKD